MCMQIYFNKNGYEYNCLVPYLLFYERQNLVHEKFFSKVTSGAKSDDDSGSEEGTDDDKCVLQ